MDLSIGRGEIFVLLGGSGSGKTTLLRAIGGFAVVSAGRITLGGQDITHLPPYRRPVNTTFQSYALFPHMTVAANIGFGLRRQGIATDEIARRVDALLELVRLPGMGARRPDALSGGQRQRVALARALAPRPRLLLLDEPLSALDRNLREQTRQELLRVQAETGTTFVLVTHDQDEALAIATRIGLLHHGRLEQVGTPAEVYERPATRYVAEFMGASNIFPAMADAHGVKIDGIGPVMAPTAPPGPLYVALRPERLALGTQHANVVTGTIERSAYRGAAIEHLVRLPGGPALLVSEPLHAGLGTPRALGAAVQVCWPAEACILLAS